MMSKNIAKTTLAAGVVAMVADKAVAKVDSAAVDTAIKSLETYDWGSNRKALNPIDDAINATHGDTAARKALEKRLLDALSGGISRSAQDYVCRRLRVMGTSQSVKTLSDLLLSEKSSHIARYALGCIPDDKAVESLRAALPKVSNKLKSGIIGSLGVHRDKESVKAISKHLGDSDTQVARAAAHSLALIGTSAAARELSRFAKKMPANMKIPVADACLIRRFEFRGSSPVQRAHGR